MKWNQFQGAFEGRGLDSWSVWGNLRRCNRTYYHIVGLSHSWGSDPFEISARGNALGLETSMEGLTEKDDFEDSD